LDRVIYHIYKYIHGLADMLQTQFTNYQPLNSLDEASIKVLDFMTFSGWGGGDEAKV